MDVVLIDSPTSHEQEYGDWDLSKVATYCPPLGLLHIASFVRSRGHNPHVLDLTARNWSLEQAVDFVQQKKTWNRGHICKDHKHSQHQPPRRKNQGGGR